jgi:hypothetical protein
MTMTDKVDESRVLSAAERAGHDARMERARTGRQLLHALCEVAVLAPCGQCWAPRGTPCSRGASGPGYHVARFARARRRGLLTEAELDVITNAAIVRDGAR